MELGIQYTFCTNIQSYSLFFNIFRAGVSKDVLQSSSAPTTLKIPTGTNLTTSAITHIDKPTTPMDIVLTQIPTISSKSNDVRYLTRSSPRIPKSTLVIETSFYEPLTFSREPFQYTTSSSLQSMTGTADLVQSETTGYQFTYPQNTAISSLKYDATSIADGMTSLSWSVASPEGFSEYTNISPSSSSLHYESTSTSVIEHSQTSSSLHTEAITTQAIENFNTTAFHFETHSEELISPKSTTKINVMTTSTQDVNTGLSSISIQSTTRLYSAASTDSRKQTTKMQGTLHHQR